VAEYRVLRPFTYLRGDGAIVRQTKAGVLAEFDDKVAEQAGSAIEPVSGRSAPLPSESPQPEPEPTPESKPKRRHKILGDDVNTLPPGEEAV
jgi:hypothetical protein